MEVSNGKILFPTVQRAFQMLNIKTTEEQTAFLIWYDTLKECEQFKDLHPWQIINRIPGVNILCRKAPFAILQNRLGRLFPHTTAYQTKRWILPQEREKLEMDLSIRPRKIIIKPDEGSLGVGIIILEKNQKLPITKGLYVVEEYIESYLLESTKFDLRVYVLVQSIEPLVIYVYRDGVARFCGKKVTEKSLHSQVTNTYLNKSVADINQITKLISQVFNDIEKQGHNIQDIWKRIDEAVINTIISSLNYLKKAHEKEIKYADRNYSRCFQILGFDVMLDSNLNPHILEVNYRPSLERGTLDESRLKVSMLTDAVKTVLPPEEAQRYTEGKEWGSIPSKLRRKVNKEYKNRGKTGRGFAKVFPKGPEAMKEYGKMISVIKSLPTKIDDKTKLPVV